MPVTDIISTPQAEKGFYPTPLDVAYKMLDGIDWLCIQSVLEPSAGKGDLIACMMRSRISDMKNAYNRFNLDVDCCELDPYLRQILKYNFSEEKLHELYKQDKPGCDDRWSRDKGLQMEMDVIDGCDLHIVHDDFLTFHTYKKYDLILMNPPFADGDKHLLHALEMQKNGGCVICLLNAETIRNPYTASRQLLARRLQELNAEINIVEDAFSNAERAADVDVAIIKVIIPEAECESTFYNRMKDAPEYEPIPDAEIHDLVAGDYIEQAIQLYNTEVAATMALVREYQALVPYIYSDFSDSKYKSPIITLTVGTDNYTHGFNLAKYMKCVRLKYWNALFENKKFTSKMTSKLVEKYRQQVERMADYDFTAFNIKQVMAEMNAEISSGIEKAIMDLFDKLTEEHAWYPECSKNRHYYNGWKTNLAHKIGKKCIIPTHGMFSSYSWSKDAFEVSTAYSVISDLEKAFSYLDTDRGEDTELLERLQIANAVGKTKNIYCKYFSVDLYKKGTTHIKFHPEAMKIVDRLNIYASKKRGWLPPNYGKTTYGNMGGEEKAVVDSFHGSGEEGSGEKEYAEVMANASFYLAEPTKNVPMLTSGV